MDITGGYAFLTRCSTEEQSKNGFSHEYQLTELRRAVEHCSGATFMGTYSDTISGTTFNRPKLLELYNFCKDNRGLIAYVLVQRWDRFGRDLEETTKWIRLFKEVGVEVNCPNNKFDYSDPTHILMKAIHLGLAETESRKISERTKNGLNAGLREGYYMASAPFGYSREKKNTKHDNEKQVLVPNDNAVFVREAYRRVADGEHRTAVFKDMKKRYDLKLAKSSFFRMMTNIVYVGQVFCPEFKGEPEVIVTGKHEAIIDELLFTKVQVAIAKTEPIRSWSWSYRDKDDNEFPYKPIMYCNLTGKNMSGSFAKKKFPYYHPTKGKGMRIRMEKAHDIVEKAIEELCYNYQPSDVQIVNNFLQEKQKPQRDFVKQLEKQRKNYKKRMVKIREDYMNGKITDAEDYENFKSELKPKVDQLTVEIENAKASSLIDAALTYEDMAAMYSLQQLMAMATNKQRRRLLELVFPERITFNDEKTKVRTAYINELFTLSDTESVDYEFIEIKKRDSRSRNPALGG